MDDVLLYRKIKDKKVLKLDLNLYKHMTIFLRICNICCDIYYLFLIFHKAFQKDLMLLEKSCIILFVMLLA